MKRWAVLSHALMSAPVWSICIVWAGNDLLMKQQRALSRVNWLIVLDDNLIFGMQNCCHQNEKKERFSFFSSRSVACVYNEKWMILSAWYNKTIRAADKCSGCDCHQVLSCALVARIDTISWIWGTIICRGPSVIWTASYSAMPQSRKRWWDYLCIRTGLQSWRGHLALSGFADTADVILINWFMSGI